MGEEKPPRTDAPPPASEAIRVAGGARENFCSEWLGSAQVGQVPKGINVSLEARKAAGSDKEYPLLPLTSTEENFGRKIIRYKDENGDKYEDGHYFSGNLSESTITYADGKKIKNERYSERENGMTGQTVHYLDSVSFTYIGPNNEKTQFDRYFDWGGQLTHAQVLFPDGTGTEEFYKGGVFDRGESHKNRTIVSGSAVTRGAAKLAYDDLGLIRRNPQTGEPLYQFTGDYKGIYVSPSSTNTYNDKWWPF